MVLVFSARKQLKVYFPSSNNSVIINKRLSLESIAALLSIFRISQHFSPTAQKILC